jgi:hypothetical protein
MMGFDCQRCGRRHASGETTCGERGSIFGQDFGPLIRRTPVEPLPIPELVDSAIPARVKSFEINLSQIEADAKSIHDELADIVSRVLAEDRRVRRMLPPARPGYEWHGELQRLDGREYGFTHTDDKLRIVYSLRAIPE